jgi:pyruvate dehydrogenase E2 component (dihydrolipoamide acetyltransferase)
MAAPILMPKLGLTMEVGTVVAWKKKEGDAVAKGEALLEVETDKIVTEVVSPLSGLLLKVLVPEGTEAKVQAVLAVVGEQGEDLASFLAAPMEGTPIRAEESEAATVAEAAGVQGGGRQRISPRARKLLADHGFSPADMQGSSSGRITEAEAQEFLASRAPAVGDGQLQSMSGIEKLVAARMTESFRDVPQFSLRFLADMDRLLAVLPRLTQAAGRDITINDLILRAAAVALSRNPQVQYQFRDEGIFKPGGVHVGFAVALGRDLVVPVIHDADRKRAAEISREAGDLIEKAKSRRLRPEDVTGGTFTVSNLGMFGISSFVPIVNPGEGAILGVGALQSVPVVRDGAVTAARVVELTLVCDHRSVNGAVGAGFCSELKHVLESAEEAEW